MKQNKENVINNLCNFLRPPGLGVFTVSNSKEKKDQLFKKIYGIKNDLIVQEKFQYNLKNINTKLSHINLLGMPSDNGAGILRGSNWGPFYIRERIYENKKLQNDLFDLGDIPVIPHLLHDKYLNKETINQCKPFIYKRLDKSFNTKFVSPLSVLENFSAIYFKNFFKHPLLTIGGDHSISYPLVKNYLKAKKAKKEKCAIIHFDAHTDLSTQRLGIDLCFGTWAYHIIPYLNNSKDLIQIGIRSSAQKKSYWEKKYGIQQFWSHEINKNGPDLSLKKISKYLLKNNINTVYLSFDIDAIDSNLVSATGTPESGGLSLQDCIYIIEMISKIAKIEHADLVEVAPNLKHFDNNNYKDQTLFCAFKLIETMNNIWRQQ